MRGKTQLGEIPINHQVRDQLTLSATSYVKFNLSFWLLNLTASLNFVSRTYSLNFTSVQRYENDNLGPKLGHPVWNNSSKSISDIRASNSETKKWSFWQTNDFKAQICQVDYIDQKFHPEIYHSAATVERYSRSAINQWNVYLELEVLIFE